MGKTLQGLRIIFLGTPAFAVASLDKLVQAGLNIVAVVTAPDKPAGRGLQMQESAVKKYAIEHGLKLLQPVKLKDPQFLDELRALAPDIQAVVAFRMLPEAVWNLPPLGTINVHASLLPQYRGAAPINWAIINGEKYTGVTTFRLKHEIDTGNILLFEKTEIRENETAGEVHDRLQDIGADLLLETITGIAFDTLEEKPQSDFTDASVEIKHAPKIFVEACRINFHKNLQQVHDQIRGLSPYPGAFTELEGKMLKIFRGNKTYDPVMQVAGEYETDKKTYLRFACIDGYYNVTELQLEGKRKLSISDFLRGYHFNK